ncbi:MAG: hypothetical protein HY774_20870 [Acidobacteria bacterium]|nr:hypothetical protein [Acidobacteriota bacterium]
MVDESVLLETLNQLTEVQLHGIIVSVGMPQSEQRGSSAQKGERVIALLNWAKSPNGCGLGKIEAELKKLVSSPKETSPRVPPEPRRHFLLIEIPPPMSPRRKYPDQIEFWFFHDDEPGLSDIRPCEPSLKGVQAAVIGLLNQLLAGDLKTKVNVQNLFLEFLIPIQYFSWGIDQWSYREAELGAYHSVVLRWRDRTTAKQNPEGCQVWSTVANKIKTCPELCQTPTVFWLPDEHFSSPKKLVVHLVQKLYGACVGFSVVPDLTKESVEGKLLLTCLQNGVPFALWSREQKDWVVFREHLGELVKGGTLEELPLRIRELRENAMDNPTHHGSALTFLWDDPRRNPMAHKFIPFR